jgi:PAS domain S-box-containing protein
MSERSLTLKAADEDAEARNRRLEAALREATETLDAIRNGDVDAVVVGGPHGQVVYTLESADRPYRVLVEQMREGAVTLDLQGTIFYCNQSFAELIGRRSEDIIGHPIFDYVQETDKLGAMLNEAPAEGASAELSLIPANGGLTQTNLSIVNMVVEAGEARMLCMIVTDLRQNYERARELAQANQRLASEISERRRAEQSLAIALDAADMGSWDLDIAADDSVRSPRHDAIFGHPEPLAHWGLEDAVEHFLPEDRKAFTDAMAQAAVTGRLDVERRIRRANDGVVRWVQIRGRTFYRAGKPDRIVGIIIDNTERRLLDEALRQGQKMEAIGQLTGGIAHDFNNLLMIIGGSLEALSRRVTLDERVQKLLDAARLGVTRGARLNEQLLAFARRQDMREQSVCITDLLPTFETLLDRAIGEAVKVEVRRSDGLWFCMTDPHQLETAILNLAINARDAMNDRGSLILSTRNASVAADQSEAHGAAAGDYVVVCVTDDGPGMTADVAARVFEPFFTTKPVGKGTGLGLSQVYGFARQSGGFIELDTRPGEGAAVSIYLPRTDPPSIKALESDVPGQEYGADGTVLLVEDDSDVREATRSLLVELGYKVVEAASANEAIGIIADGVTVDLVFTDVIMSSGMTGIELARRLKASHTGLPILLASGYTAQRLVPDAGNDDLPLLRKPYTLAQLAEAVGQIMCRR